MLGDRYRVFTSADNYTTPAGVFDTWSEAKEARNELFFGGATVQSAWIMRENPSLNLRPSKYGSTLRKEKQHA